MLAFLVPGGSQKNNVFFYALKPPLKRLLLGTLRGLYSYALQKVLPAILSIPFLDKSSMAPSNPLDIASLHSITFPTNNQLNSRLLVPR